MRVITLNINGIRSGAKKGFFEWLSEENADLICLQETKAEMDALDKNIFCPAGYHCYYHDATRRKGYSGVAIFTKKTPEQTIQGLGWSDADTEGRCLQLDYPHFSIVSLYMPSGSSGEERQAIKFTFMQHYAPILKKLMDSKRTFIICGDWNIVHKEIDIKNFKSNQKHSGCLPEERAWLDKLLTSDGWVDAFRVLNQEPDQYTWWSHRGQAYAKNVGWRIDYQMVTPDLKDRIKSVRIYKERRFSDHAPLIVDYDLTW